MSSDPMTRFRCTALRRSGATDIRIIHAANADAARDRLIAAGLEPVTIEAVGPSLTDGLIARLRDGLPRLRYPVPQLDSKLISTTVLLIGTASITLMIGAWALLLVTIWQGSQLLRDEAAPIARYRALVADEGTRALARPAMTTPGPTEILGRLAAILPPDTGLAAATRDRHGALRIEIDTSDPDQIRPVVAADPLFGSLREIGQVQTGEGTIRVTLASESR